MRYPLSPNPIFWTINGEAHLRGQQMVFIRLAGCSVGCPQCDTDYRVDSRATVEEIVARACAVTPPVDRDCWAWITGGEPTDHDLRPLLRGLRQAGFATAVATSGVRRMNEILCDWISVSPHSADPGTFIQRVGHEIKLGEGLNGLDLDEWYRAWPDERTDFMHRYVQPLWRDGREDPDSLARCLDFLSRHPRWALSRQDHKFWGVP